MKNDRLFQIIYILLERQTIAAPELARELEVSVRTIYRDVQALCMAGVPVCTTPGKGGGISLQAGYTFDHALLSDDEQNQILFALQSLQAAGQNVDGLLRKLGASFRKDNTNWIEVDFSRWGMRREDHSKFDSLKTAILEKRVLKFTYCGASGAITDREVKPAKLIFKDKNWYLQAYCLKAQSYRLFKINRMQKITLTALHFTDAFANLPPVHETFPLPESFTTLKLSFPTNLAFRVYDELDPDCIHPSPDGRLLVTLQASLDGWLYSYLLSFGASVDILEPAALREQIAAYAAAIAEHHQS